MISSPKTVIPLYTLQNPLVRFDLGEGDFGFNWVGVSAIERKRDGVAIGRNRLIVNVRHLWEIVCVRPTKDATTEHFKVVTPAQGSFSAAIFTGPEVAPTTLPPTTTPTTIPEDPTLEAGATLVRLTWTNILVDGNPLTAGLDRLNVTVEIELRVDEPFARMRIDVRWARNDNPDSATPGRYGIWRVRFPIIDVAPASSLDTSDDVNLIDVEGADFLVVPENHGLMCENPTATAKGDPTIGMFSAASGPRNVVRSGASWRQTYPGAASTQAMGYVAQKTGRGFLVGALDHGGHLKDLEAGGQPGSVWMHVVHVPEWAYVIGNRPNGFSGHVEGDSPATFEASMLQPPWAAQDIDVSGAAAVPNTRSVDAGASVSAGANVMALGLARMGFAEAGTMGDNVAKSLWLGYVSPFDIALAPVIAHGAQKWNELAKVWREICDIPDAVFPLLEKRNASALHPAASAQAILEIDASVNDGQYALFGTMTADLPAALAAGVGVTTELDELLSKKTLVVDRAIVSDRPVVSSDEDVGGEILDANGRPAGIVPYVGPTSGRGYIQLFGSSGFYVAPKQIPHGYFYNNVDSYRDGVVAFEDFDPVAAGVKAGDFISIVTRSGLAGAYWGRRTAPVASNSESARMTAPLRIIKEVRDDGTLVVGKFEGGTVKVFGYPSSLIEELDDGHFEVEIMRRELNMTSYGTVQSTARGTLRVAVNLSPTDLDMVAPKHSLGWAEVVESETGAVMDYVGLYSEVGVESGMSVIRCYVEVKSRGATAADLTSKALRIRKRVEPLSLLEYDVVGKLLVLDGVSVNARSRSIEFGDSDQVDALLNEGIVGFAQPLVSEPRTGDFTFAIYPVSSSSSRVLGPEADLIGGGHRFIDEGYASEVPGGFKAKLRKGDLLELIGATEAANQEPFNVEEILSESEVLVTGTMVTEEGLSYRVVRKGDLLRDLRSVRTDARNWRNGPRALRAGGYDRVHFLAVGWVADPNLPVTGVFGQSSSAWAELGANPFVPASSANIATYERSRGVLKPTVEFGVQEVISESELRIFPGWEPEDRSFSVTFTDVGSKTFEKNVLQYCIVRDDRLDDDVQTFEGVSPAFTGWARTLGTTALFAILRGWHRNLLGHDQPDFLPSRGSFDALLAGMADRVAPALDPMTLRPSSTLYEDLRLIAAQYFNRFGLTAHPEGTEEDHLLDPRTSYGRGQLLEEILGNLVTSGARHVCFDELQGASRDSYGSPHFQKADVFEIAPSGGGISWTAGLYDLLARAGVHRSANFPGDWLLGMVGLFSNRMDTVEHEFPEVEIDFDIDGQILRPIADLTVVHLDIQIDGVTASEVATERYGVRIGLTAGDVLRLLPSGEEFEISAFGATMTFAAVVDLSGQTHYQLCGRRRLANEMVTTVPFFNFAFGAFGTVATDVTFLANDVSWSEVVSVYRDGQITEEQYNALVIDIFRRSMYLVATSALAGHLPAMTIQSEAMRRVPITVAGVDLRQAGSISTVGQGTVMFPTSSGSRPLIGWHALYLRSLISRMSEIDSFVRYGERMGTPEVTGAAELEVAGVLVNGRASKQVIASSSFMDRQGDFALAFSCWATDWMVSFPMSVSSSFVFADRDLTEGYWTAVRMNQGAPNTWYEEVWDLDVNPDSEFGFVMSFGPLETKLVLVYQQQVIVRKDASLVEVDRVLPVPKGRSVAAAFAVIALDVVKGGSGKYVVVVGAGAIADSLTIPSIPGATMVMQEVADEVPVIEETL